MKLTQRPFGDAQHYRIETSSGFIFEATNFGARITRILAPLTEGVQTDIIHGYETYAEFVSAGNYTGATVGRVAGRIKGGSYELQGERQQFTQNEGRNTLHGGAESFDRQLWQTETVTSATEVKLIFSLTSPAGENGFPGKLAMTVTYTFNEANEWRLDYRAETDAATLYNPTNHVYFNLNGDLSSAATNHDIRIAADRVAYLNEETLPLGTLNPVAGTAFDLTRGKRLAEILASGDAQVALVNGIDHPFKLTTPSLQTVQGELYSPTTGLAVSFKTDAPAVVVYTLNSEPVEEVMFGKKIGLHGAITLETQALPGAGEFPDFGSMTLLPGEVFQTSTIYQFGFR